MATTEKYLAQNERLSHIQDSKGIECGAFSCKHVNCRSATSDIQYCFFYRSDIEAVQGLEEVDDCERISIDETNV